jgi:SOS-response transcriptional repressor LexA
MAEKGITQAELARKVGTKQQTISYLIRDESNTQSSRYTTKIANVLGVNPLWLQTGEGEPHAPLLSLTQVNLFKDTCQIPIISCQDILKFLSDEPFGTKGYLMSGTNTPAKKFAFEIEDNSMSPAFAPSDVVVIETDCQPKPGDFVVAQTPKNLVLLRKFRSRGDGFELVPENPDWGVSSDSDGTKIIGVMVEHRRYWKR